MRLFITALLFVLTHSIAYCQWQVQAIKTDADFRGLSVVSSSVAWVSGTKGTFGRTTDGGKNWSVGTVPDADKLDFRDVEAFGADTACLLSAGPGADSRVYKTSDGGKSWKLQFQNAEPKAFFDAIAFWDEKHGIALSDPVNGKFQLIVTNDGEKWTSLPEKSLPVALPKEGCFAASGTCLITRGESDVWFCTGGAKSARVFHSKDRGKTWTVGETPLLAGIESAGVFSIAFRDATHGVIVGGDYRKPDDTVATGAITTDGGKTWKLIEKPLPFRSCVAWAKDRWVAVGTSGSDLSADGATWKSLDKEKYNSVAFTKTGDGWAVGPKGRIAKFKIADEIKPLTTVNVWPEGKMPGKGAQDSEKDLPAKGDDVRRVTNISQPTLAIFPAAKTESAAPAMIVCAGGGYNYLCIDKEGTDIAAWLNSVGITAIVLKYRAPNNREGALQDAQRALSLARANADKWNVDPKRLGIIGFSAGGHLAAKTSTKFDVRAYEGIDAVDKLSCRPDYAVLVYPAYLAGKEGRVTTDLNMKAKIPPTLIIHSEDDKPHVPGSKIYHTALDEAKVSHEFKLYPTGGHGYGLRCTRDAKVWPQDTLDWLKKNGFR